MVKTKKKKSVKKELKKVTSKKSVGKSEKYPDFSKSGLEANSGKKNKVLNFVSKIKATKDFKRHNIVDMTKDKNEFYMDKRIIKLLRDNLNIKKENIRGVIKDVPNSGVRKKGGKRVVAIEIKK